MLKPVEVFIVKPFPEIQVCQLPSLSLNMGHLCYLLAQASQKCYFTGALTKQNIEDTFMRDGFEHLIILKSHDMYGRGDQSSFYEEATMYTEYCFLNMSMTELLEIANQSKKFHEMKAFW